MTQKVLFLDFDGVINTDRMAIDALTKEGEWRDEFGLKFDPESILNLRHIIEETQARIVAITSWKQYGLDYLQEIWQGRQMPGEISDITPDYRTDFEMDAHHQPKCVQVPLMSKGEGIEEWILQEQLQGRETQYAILDDIQSFTLDQQPHFIQICAHCGITSKDADRAIQILSQNIRQHE